MALQQWVGILSDRRTRIDFYYPSGSGFAGQDLRGSGEQFAVGRRRLMVGSAEQATVGLGHPERGDVLCARPSLSTYQDFVPTELGMASAQSRPDRITFFNRARQGAL